MPKRLFRLLATSPEDMVEYIKMQSALSEGLTSQTFSSHSRATLNVQITRELLYGQIVADRPDLCVRVLHQKLKELMDDLIKRKVLKSVVAHIHVIEFQKRGLPHAHIVLIISDADKPGTIEDIDRIVSARIPDPIEQPLAFETVKNCMMHGPCGNRDKMSPCMKDNKCSKEYPKEFCEETTAQDSNPCSSTKTMERY